MKPRLIHIQQLALDLRLTGAPVPIGLGYVDAGYTRVELVCEGARPMICFEHFGRGDALKGVRKGRISYAELDREDRAIFDFIVDHGLEGLENYLEGLYESKIAALYEDPRDDLEAAPDPIIYNDAGEPIGYC